MITRKVQGSVIRSGTLVAAAVSVFIGFVGALGATKSNGNYPGQSDVGIWYLTMYDAKQWTVGSFPDRSIKYLPLCPNPITYSGNWSYGAVSGAINGDCHTSHTPGASVTNKFTGTGIRVIGE